jgi:2-polyprenyl-3-methyl-5-hydroxy-6-metoxy-1,4-benzoquinol methylase
LTADNLATQIELLSVRAQQSGWYELLARQTPDWPAFYMKVEYKSFADRSVRSRYIAERFKEKLQGKVLDVGCDQAVLKKLLPALDYIGIDVGGKPDLVVNLEEMERLPFESGAFDCVICADVLEHLDNFHFVFDEVVRVSRGCIILSLPNNWANARRPIARGRGSIGHYGLPLEPPVDRHKWFFSLAEARQFIEAKAQKHPLVIRELYAMEKRRFAPVRHIRRMFHGSQLQYLNRYAHTLWAVLEKR